MIPSPSMEPTLRDIMAADPESVAPHTPIRRVAEMMRDGDIGALPVVSDGQLVGIVTDRDIIVNAVAAGVDVDQTTIGPFVSTDLVTGTPDMTLARAADLMSRYQVRRLPVVDNGRLVGMVSMQDIAEGGGPSVAGVVERNIAAEG